MRAIPKLLLLGAMVVLPPVLAQPCNTPYLVEQRFPMTGAEQTRWRVCWQLDILASGLTPNGLVIASAEFRTAPGAPWVQVLGDTRMSEIFVPYHDNSNRFYDVLRGLLPAPVKHDDCPAGARLKSDPMQPANVCREIRDRGLVWKKGADVRRGQELVLWGAVIAGNYNYVLEWTFRDDGVFIGRAGATASVYSTSPTVTHMHNPIWRIDVDLNGPAGDSVNLGVHKEVGLLGDDTPAPFSTENGVEWNQFQFNFLDISDASLTNTRTPPEKTSYMLMPLLFGTSRHMEDFTKNDLWVTPHDNSQMSAHDLPSYLTGRNVSNADVVLWYKGSLHHIPRREDGESVAGSWHGSTLVMWTGFMLMPNNLFDRTPLYP